MPDATEFVLVQITAKDEVEAQQLAELLLRQRKAACVNIVPMVSTIYHWHSKIESGTESLMLVKTRRALLDDLIKIIKAHHSYQLPEIIATPLLGGSNEYLSWLENETGS
ncbi:MAG: divalent-cation tolerance protein CutA [Dehalococcoidia bacterium]|nr:divalent-cation tolerance protein CutA [Dehalococcoidia bacterium]